MNLLVLAAALMVQEAEPGHVGDGPLHFRTQSPFQSVRSGFIPATPSDLPAGGLEVGFAGSWVNVWAFDDNWLLDYEMVDQSLWFSHGVSDRLAVTFELQHGFRFGGRIDHLIEEFHDLAGIDQDHRDELPENDFRFDVAANGSRPPVSLSNSDRGTFIVSGTLTAQYALIDDHGPWPALSAAVSIRAASHRDIRSQGIDAAVSFSAARRWGNVHLYASVNLAWYGHEDFEDVELRPLQWFCLGAIEWCVMPRTSFVFQYLISQGAVSRYDDFSEPSHEVTFGWKVEIHPGTVLEVGLVENLVTWDNSPDFGFHYGIRHRW